MDYSGKIIRKTPVTPSQTSASGVWSLDEALQAQRTDTWPVANVPDPISRSLRFKNSTGSYLNRTPAAASNRKTWTWSAWVKRGFTGDSQFLFSSWTANNDAGEFDIYINPTGNLIIQQWTAAFRVTNAIYRDPSAWYHVVVAIDTTQATAGNRVKLYVNGSEVTSFSTTNNPTLNQDLAVNQAGAHYLSSYKGSLYYLEGYMTEVQFIDGQALTASSFGGTSSATGVWEPRVYTGTYGTNGFYLPFSNITNTTTLGNDFSGNNNNWTTNNISLTAGVTYDSMLDVPTQWIGYNTGDAVSVTRGNYCVINPISNPNSPIYTISAGNLNYSCSASTGNAPKMAVTGSILMQGLGKYYCEATETSSNSTFGVTSGLVAGGTANGVNFATVYNGGTNSSAATYSGTTPSFTSGDVIGLAFDVSALTLAIYKNGTLLGTLSGLESTVNGWLFLQTVGTGALSTSAVWNFGQRPFSYTPPAGFLSLCTTNLPSPTILQGDDYFNTVLYTGNGSTQSITGVGFQPDFVWLKSRSSGSRNHFLFDAVRGTSAALYSNLTTVETTSSGVTAFDSDGFSIGSNGNGNENTQTYVGWNWKASNAAAVSNVVGTITSSVSANTTAGFSIVTYTGNGVGGATVGHGLGTALSMLIVKNRVQGTYGNWNVWHTAITGSQYLSLNLTDAVSTNTNRWNGTVPTSSVFSLGADSFGNTNKSGDTYVAYCFAAVPGYSAFGSYAGNSSTDGTFVYTGFRPAYVLIKRSSAAGQWTVRDKSRLGYNPNNYFLEVNQSSAESSSTGGACDLLSNGFKLKTADDAVNETGSTYIYMAFAENPFKNSLAR